MDLSKQSLLDFIDVSIDKGRMNKNTGGGIRAACRKILEQVAPDVDVRTIDVTAEVVQYNNRHPGELSADSLRVYESRVRSVIESFVQSKTDPTGYKLPGKTNGAKSPRATKRGAEKEPKAAVGEAVEPAGSAQPSPAGHLHARAAATETSLALPFPLRPNFLAQVVVPRDLTKDEARRLAAFLDALAHDAPSA
jgi:hypothetical protein